VAHVTGEDSHEIRYRGSMLSGPEVSGPGPECLLDVLLVDLPEMGTVDWDAVLGDGGFRTPFYARRTKAKTRAATSVRESSRRYPRDCDRPRSSTSRYVLLARRSWQRRNSCFISNTSAIASAAFRMLAWCSALVVAVCPYAPR